MASHVRKNGHRIDVKNEKNKDKEPLEPGKRWNHGIRKSQIMLTVTQSMH